MTMRKEGPPRPVAIGQAMREFLDRSGLKRRFPRRGLSEAWCAAAGPEVARRSRVLGLNARGELRVEVAGAALFVEVAGFRKPQILERLRAEMPDTPVRDLVVRHGTF
jgi:hypothetical protein